MTKKDYIIIAKAVNKALSSLTYTSVDTQEAYRCLTTVAESLAYELKLENSKFNESKFFEACLTKRA